MTAAERKRLTLLAGALYAREEADFRIACVCHGAGERFGVECRKCEGDGWRYDLAKVAEYEKEKANMTGRECLESIGATLNEAVPQLALCECWQVPESPAGCAVTVWRERAAWSVPWQVVAGVGELLTGTFSDDQVDDCIRAARRMAGELVDSTEGRR